MLTLSQKKAETMRKTTNFSRLLLLAAISLNSTVTLAAMYKWVDEDGNTNYTQSPPPGDLKAETIKAPPKINPDHAKKQLEERKKLLQEAGDSRTKAADEKRKAEQVKEQKKADCDKAKARLASYSRPRVNLLDENGNPARATEEQRQAEIAKSRELIAKLCN